VVDPTNTIDEPLPVSVHVLPLSVEGRLPTFQTSGVLKRRSLQRIVGRLATTAKLHLVSGAFHSSGERLCSTTSAHSGACVSGERLLIAISHAFDRP
jgi:hypothetical protein